MKTHVAGRMAVIWIEDLTTQTLIYVIVSSSRLLFLVRGDLHTSTSCGDHVSAENIDPHVTRTPGECPSTYG